MGVFCPQATEKTKRSALVHRSLIINASQALAVIDDNRPAHSQHSNMCFVVSKDCHNCNTLLPETHLCLRELI